MFLVNRADRGCGQGGGRQVRVKCLAAQRAVTMIKRPTYPPFAMHLVLGVRLGADFQSKVPNALSDYVTRPGSTGLSPKTAWAASQ